MLTSFVFTVIQIQLYKLTRISFTSYIHRTSITSYEK